VDKRGPLQTWPFSVTRTFLTIVSTIVSQNQRVAEILRRGIRDYPVRLVLYPNDDILRTAIGGCAAYQLNWFDAHMWAYAEHYGLEEIITEDPQHDRLYGTVRIVNPFVGLKAG
jgi:predicted nucleic acid-binding protein